MKLRLDIVKAKTVRQSRIRPSDAYENWAGAWYSLVYYQDTGDTLTTMCFIEFADLDNAYKTREIKEVLFEATLSDALSNTTADIYESNAFASNVTWNTKPSTIRHLNTYAFATSLRTASLGSSLVKNIRLSTEYNVTISVGVRNNEINTSISKLLLIIAPDPPTLKSPIGGFVNLTTGVTFSWDAISQLKAEIRFYQDGIGEKIFEVEKAKEFTLPANTYAAGVPLRWTARVYDEDELWSDFAPEVIVGGEQATPESPELIRPVGISLDVSKEILYRWMHRAPDGAPQTSARIQISEDRGNTWATHTVGKEEYYTSPPNAYSIGSKLWRVQTGNDRGIYGAFCPIAEFTVYGRPLTPSITSVSSGTSRPTVEWASSGQSSYEVEVLRAGVIIYSSGTVVSLDTSHKVAEFLDEGSYEIRVRINNVYGFTSDWDTRPLLINTVKPPAPDIFVADSAHFVRIMVNDVDSEISKILIYRQRVDDPHPDGVFDDTNMVIVASLDPGETLFDDYAIAARTRYGYFARAVTNADTFEDSAIQIGICSMIGSVFSLAANPSQHNVNVKFNIDNPVSRNSSLALQGSPIYYVGRTLPVYEFSEFTESKWTLNAMFETNANLMAFKRLISLRETMLYRDQFGRKMYINVTSIDTAPDRAGTIFSLPFEEVDYHE